MEKRKNNMGKALEKLRALVKESFKENDTSEGVKQLALFENGIKECEAEEEEILNKQKELVKDYKELLLNQGNDKKIKEDVPSGVAPSFDEALAKFIEENKEKK